MSTGLRSYSEFVNLCTGSGCGTNCNGAGTSQCGTGSSQCALCTGGYTPGGDECYYFSTAYSNCPWYCGYSGGAIPPVNCYIVTALGYYSVPVSQALHEIVRPRVHVVIQPACGDSQGFPDCLNSYALDSSCDASCTCQCAPGYTRDHIGGSIYACQYHGSCTRILGQIQPVAELVPPAQRLQTRTCSGTACGSDCNGLGFTQCVSDIRCQCTPGTWVNSTCGGGYCAGSQRLQTRICTGNGCGSDCAGLGVTNCVADPTCNITVTCPWPSNDGYWSNAGPGGGPCHWPNPGGSSVSPGYPLTMHTTRQIIPVSLTLHVAAMGHGSQVVSPALRMCQFRVDMASLRF